MVDFLSLLLLAILCVYVCMQTWDLVGMVPSFSHISVPEFVRLSVGMCQVVRAAPRACWPGQPLVPSFHLHTKERQESHFIWLLDQAVCFVLHTWKCLDASGCVAVTQEMLEKTITVYFFFFLISLVIIGGALLLKTLISLCDSDTLGKQPQLFLLPLVVFLVMCL